MPLWTRIALLLAVTAWSFYRAMRIEDRALRRLVAAARGSVKRALVAVTLYYVALVGVLATCGVFAAVAHQAGEPAVAIIILLAGLVLTTPSMWVLAPSGDVPGVPATSFPDLRRRRASRGVARAIAYPAVAYHFLLLLPAILGTAAAVILME